MSQLSPNPQAARAIARRREERALKLLYEQGGAVSAQLGRHMYGPAFRPSHHNHLSVLRRLRRRGLVAFITTPLGPRLYYLTPLGHAAVAEQVAPDHRLPRASFHSGRSPVTLAHDLGVLDLRLAVENRKLEFISEKILRAAWGKQAGPKLPDGLIGLPSSYSYWPYRVPVALEYEYSPRSRLRRLLMLAAGEAIIGRRVAAVVVVTRPATVEAWKTTVDQARREPVFRILGTGGWKQVRLDTSLLRFWAFCTPESLISLLEYEGLRLARRSQGTAEWPWESYSPWLAHRQLNTIMPTPGADPRATSWVLA